MKKIFILLACLVIFSGCSKQEKEKVIEEVKKPEIIDNTPKYIDDNPVKIAFYENNKILKEYSTNASPMTDINVFSVLFTNDEDVSGNYKTLFNNYYNQYENKEKYKIGYYIKFNVEDKIVEKTIVDPTSTYDLNPYMYVYLYDDIHQADGAFYSHVKEEDVKEDTLYTSIKLFMVGEIANVTSPITLEAFTYDSDDDFDDNGNYRGNSKYSIEIKLN